MNDPWRERARTALERHFERAGFPRLLMSMIVAITGGIGFFVSWLLLKMGEVEMWMRYPVAVAAAYVVFLGLLRLWAEFERHRLDPDIARLHGIEQPATPFQPSNLRTNGSWFDFLDVGNFDFADEGCFAVAALVLVAAAVGGALFYVVASAPALISDVFLDAVLMTMLYKRLKNAARRHWLGTAIRRTWIAALITAVALSAGGAVIQSQWPNAKTIGDAWRQKSEKKKGL